LPSARTGGAGMRGSINRHCSSVKSIAASPLRLVKPFYHF
jgi:hypothetical protein